MNTRIWFVGSHGTGKTTQLEHFLGLHPYFHRMDSSKERRRLVEQGIIKVNREAAPWDEIVIGGTVMQAILSTPSPSISDRHWVDKCAYAQLLPYSDEIVDAMHIYYSAALPGVTENDAFFYFPPMLELVGDGIRDTNKEYQRDVDTFVVHYLIQFGINYFMVTAESVQDRYLQIIDYLKTRELEF